ncbi:hypothetical protein GGR88_001329 [Sphingomonas jejuensis]|uniref:Minor tail protein n=1 Tax=Sphingomonas jejuensis TaxID=904715 RepID=A0ABX0XKT8_9SPHN|nr:phage tail protein [Sphingomonas jejuensis]NJC33855.1 hypothetical protein [Sphingomonas jejuensis]
MAKAVKSVASVIGTVAGVVATVASFIPPLAPIAAAARAVALGASLVAGVAGMLSPAKAASRGTGERLQASLVASASRLSVHGRTAMGTDVRYEEFVGAEQEYLWRVFAVASHRVHSIQELWLDAKLAWSSATGVAAEFAGYLQVTPILEATATNTVYISPRWSAATRRRLTGCALLYVRFKRTGNSKKAESPFAQAITNRVTIVGEGRLYYDPRRDSTVPGGSGTMRADNQATWAYTVGSDAIGRNGALGLLNQLLGWRINGKLAVGRGTPPSRLDLASWITAANLADEAVAKAAGGTEPRYRTDGVVTEDEEGSAVIQRWEGAINGRLIDDGGRLSLRIWHNDLALPVAHFTASDVLGGVLWEPTLSLDETRNVGRGRYIDASPQALYQAVDYPHITIPSPDGIDRVLSADFDLVQSVGQAQRLIKQRLQRMLYGGRFTADFRAVGWGVKRGDVITLDFPHLGFVARLFRVLERTISLDGRCRMVLLVEHPSIYAWDREEAPAVQLPEPDIYDWRNYPLLAALDEVEARPGPAGPAGPAGPPGERGLDGQQGIQGPPGAGGLSERIHLAYANSADGVLDFTIGAADGRRFIGVYVDQADADSQDPATYTWSPWRGSDGANGIPGAAGANGQPTYIHFAYSNAPNGTVDFSIDDPTNRRYIGVYTDQTLADSPSPASYTWSLIQGPQGVQGNPGAPGAQGVQGIQGVQGVPGQVGPAGRATIVYNQDAQPTSGMVAGDVWHRPTSKELYRFDGTYWQRLLGNVAALDQVDANHINVTSLSAISANIGTFTTQDARGSMYISGPLIEARHPNGTLAFRIGLP